MRHKLARFGFLAFYGVALGISGWFLVTRFGVVAREHENLRLQALDDIRTELALSMQTAQTFVELMQSTMENEMAVRPRNAPPSRLLAALQQKEDGSYNLDALPEGISKFEVGNLTGLGNLNDADPELRTELAVALSLRSVFGQALTELPNVPWAYYISARRFEHVFPWQSSSDFAFEDKDLEQEYYVRGAPAMNPDRIPYVTPVYEDDSGEGLMVTIGRPVYSANQFLGVVALDFTLSYIDSVLAKFPKTFGNVYLVDQDRRVVGYSGRVKPEDAVALPEFLVKSELLDADHIGDSPNVAVLDDVKIVTQGLSILPFALVATQPTTRSYGQIVRGASLEILSFAAVIFLLAFIEWYRRNARLLAKAKEDAEDATRAKSSFLAMMSHEIRTPMNGVMSMAEMLDQSDLSEDQRSMSAVIRSSAAALLTIINDILDFSKIEAGKLDIEHTPFSLVDVAEGAGELVCQRAEDKGISLAVVVDPGVPQTVLGDPTRIRQVLINLLGNAVKFTETGGVTLRVLPKSSEVIRFEIIDSGIGLTAQQQSRLFKAFEQADVSTSRKYGGTGLGLSISQRLCELMSGCIGVQSEAGVGSTFWLELPLPAAPGGCDNADVSDARAVCVGFSGATRDAMDAILAALNAAPARHLPYEDNVLVHIFDGQDIVFLSAQGGDPRALILGEEITAHAKAISTPMQVVLAAPRSQASTLSETERAGFFAAMTLPLRRGRVRQVIAAAMGRGSLTDRTATDDEKFDPPDVETARAAGALVLVAEDNSTNQVVIRRMLEKLGFALEIGGDGRQALDMYRPGQHGLLLTDFHMPHMDGFQLTAEIRAREKSTGHRLPIVALTADALPGTEQRCLDAGMDGYLTKPIDSKMLADTLHKLVPQALALRRHHVGKVAAVRDPVAHIDPLIFNVPRLKETFGDVGPETCAFLANFIGDARRMAAAVTQAMDASDWSEARDQAHALKGAALSLGAVRLGELAAEIQDYLDQNDPETALLFVGGLETTVEELAQTVAPLIAGRINVR